MMNMNMNRNMNKFLISFFCFFKLIFSLKAEVFWPLSHSFVLEPNDSGLLVFYQAEVPQPFSQVGASIRYAFPLLKGAEEIQWQKDQPLHSYLQKDQWMVEFEKPLEKAVFYYSLKSLTGKIQVELQGEAFLKGPAHIILPRYRSPLRDALANCQRCEKWNLWPPRLVERVPPVFVERKKMNSSRYEKRQEEFPASLKPLTYDFDLIRLEELVNHFPKLTFVGLMPSRLWSVFLVLFLSSFFFFGAFFVFGIRRRRMQEFFQTAHTS